MDKKICAIGIDLTDEYAQISYMLTGDNEPVSLSTSPEEKKYLIPASLYYRRDNDTWYVGDEAKFNSISDKKDAYTFDADIKYNQDNMTKYLKMLLEYTKTSLDAEIEGFICIALEDIDMDSIKNVYNSLKTLGYSEDNVRVIGHDEAFIFYTVNQKKELWVNDVALFDFTKKHFKYRRMHEIKSKTPPVLVVESEDLSDVVSVDMLDSELGRMKADRQWMNFMTTEFKKHIVCTAFLTGQGFYDDWAGESIQEICTKRRVFKGYNLFVKGACYAAAKRMNTLANKNYIFQCNGRTKADVGLLISNEGKNMVISLSRAGCNWYEAGAEAECILDGVNKINLIITPILEGNSYTKIIDLSDFPSRPNKTTRVKIALAYKNDRCFDVVVKDMGFGELFKSSGKVVKTTISCDELFMED